jgi:hypothetical protein
MFSWLIKMLIGDLPIWLWPACAGASAVVFFLAGVISHIPQVSLYGKFVKPVAGITLLLSVFMYGGAGVNAMYQAEIKVMEGKIAVAEQAAKDANDNIKTVYVDRVKVIHDKQVVVHTKIKEVEKKINSDCKVDKEAIDILNQAAKGGTK